MHPIVNTEQAAAWNGYEGRHWATHQARWDGVSGGFNDHLFAAAVGDGGAPDGAGGVRPNRLHDPGQVRLIDACLYLRRDRINDELSWQGQPRRPRRAAVRSGGLLAHAELALRRRLTKGGVRSYARASSAAGTRGGLTTQYRI